MDEADLVRRAQAGDTAAFEVIMDRYLRSLRVSLALRCPAPHLIDEVAQDTLVYAFDHIHDFTPGSNLAAWLRAIAYNLLRTEVRRHAREQLNRQRLGQDQIGVEEAEDLPDAGNDMDAIIALQRCLEALPPSWRSLLDMRYRQAHSTMVIAEQLTRSLEWVRTNLHRARARVRNCIEQRLGGRFT